MTNQSRTSQGGKHRGRHARPPSELAVKCDRAIATALRERNRRKMVAAGAGTAAAALLAVAAVAGVSAAGPGKEPRAAAVARQARPPAAASPMAEKVAGDPDDVPDAMTFFKEKDPEEKVAKHVRDVRRSGSFLRVYTDLPEGDENSAPAISLCEWTAEYLKRHAGDGQPIVFVHAKENDNGSVVLANKQSADDDCKVSDTP